TGGDVEAVTEHFDITTIEAEQQRPTRKRPRIWLRIIRRGHRAVFFEPRVSVRRTFLLPDLLHAREDVLEPPDLLRVRLGDADVPHAVVPEVNRDRVRARRHDSAEPAISEQRAGKKIRRGPIARDRM